MLVKLFQQTIAGPSPEPSPERRRAGQWRLPETACFEPGVPPNSLYLLQGNVVALVHDSGDAEDEENDVLLNGLSHQSHLILRAEGLATGFCKDVHGQVRGALAHRELLASSVRPTAPGQCRALGYSARICPRVGGRSRKLCECRSESAPGALGPVHQGRFCTVVICSQRGVLGEEMTVRLSPGEGSKQQTSPAGS